MKPQPLVGKAKTLKWCPICGCQYSSDTHNCPGPRPLQTTLSDQDQQNRK